jgi:hypothetical protein
MLFRSLATAACLLGLFHASAQAAPISYSFAGTLSQPVNGTTAFSGTFTFTENPPGLGYGLSAASQATLKIGGQSYLFSDTSVNPPPGTQYPVGGVPAVTYVLEHLPSGLGDSFDLYASKARVIDPPSASPASMHIHLADPTGTAFPPDSLGIPPLNLNQFSVREFSFTPSPDAPSTVGTITSLERGVPEPSTIAFLALAFVGAASRRRSHKVSVKSLTV